MEYDMLFSKRGRDRATHSPDSDTSGTSSSLTKIFCSCLKLNFRVTHGDCTVSSFPHREDGTWGEEPSFREG